MSMHLDLVIPVYNEDEIIKVVVKDWISVLSELNINYRINLYNDGSTDTTIDVLKTIESHYPDVMRVTDKKNSGHGPTILRGYLESLDSDWIFQVDSDNEMKAHHFEEFWLKKDSYDFVIGKRVRRDSPKFRKLMTYISYLVVAIMYGKGVRDVNCPYRLMRTCVFKDVFTSIPKDTFAPNIMIAGMAAKKKMKIKQYDVQFETRITGVNSLSSDVLKLLEISVKSFFEIISYARKNKL
tara:strand:+ start:152 stop:868 length:717 start_codon:yes stop_codon:yes gene_type:complete